MIRRTLIPLLLLTGTVSAQCFQFSGGGVTLQVSVLSIDSAIGPAGDQLGDVTATYNFSGSANLIAGGSTTNSQFAFGTGALNIQYFATLGNPDTTTFEIVVPSPDLPGRGEHSWSVVLVGDGNLLPGAGFPGAVPGISAWAVQNNSDPFSEDQITIAAGSARLKYKVAAVGGCSAGGGPNTKTFGNPNDQPGGCGCGEPVNLATGNVYYETTDYRTAGANPLPFTRYYNSMPASSTFAAALGPNWRSNFDRYIRVNSSTSVVAERPDGAQIAFTLNGNTWTTDSDIDLALANSGNTWTLTDSKDTVETYSPASASEAILQSIQSRNGYTQTLQYGAGNQLTSVADSYQRKLNFAYSNGLLHTVSTPDGLTVIFGYTSGTLTSIGYSTTPATTQTYTYQSGNLLTGITDENGNVYTAWTYDANGRGLTNQHAGGADRISIVYKRVVWAASYQPFGGLNASASQTSALAQDLRLPGQENEQETGFYHNGFRDYAPFLGRYMQSDLISLAGGPNSYAYAANNPANLIDPLGLCELTGINTDGNRATLTFSDDSTLSVSDWAKLSDIQRLSLVLNTERELDEEAAEQAAYVPTFRDYLGDAFVYLSGLIAKDKPGPPVDQPLGSSGIRG